MSCHPKNIPEKPQNTGEEDDGNPHFEYAIIYCAAAQWYDEHEERRSMHARCVYTSDEESKDFWVLTVLSSPLDGYI